MLIDTIHGKMEEFTCGEYTHRFTVDMARPAEYRERQRKYEMWKFEKYIRLHSHGLIAV